MPVTRSTTAPPASSLTDGGTNSILSSHRAPPPFPLTSRTRPPRSRAVSSRATSSRPLSRGAGDPAPFDGSDFSETPHEPGRANNAVDPDMLVMQSTLDEVRQHHVDVQMANREADEQAASSSLARTELPGGQLSHTVHTNAASNAETERMVLQVPVATPVHGREQSHPPIESLPDFTRPTLQLDVIDGEVDTHNESRASSPPQSQSLSQAPIDLTQDSEPSSSPVFPEPSTSSPQLLSVSKPPEFSSSSTVSSSTALSSYTCPICFSPPTNATLTPCGHVCCGVCLFTAVKSTLQRGAFMGEGMGRGNLPRCPVCRAPIPGWDGTGGGVIGLRPRAVFSL